MANYTLTYNEGVKGFPSFYSYYPEYMVGMNNYFYTFSGGNIWRHNTNTTRNEYYGVLYDSEITTIFNQSPLENKIFKTIVLESDSAWDATIDSDQQSGSFINKDYFVEKEGAWFAFVRAESSDPASVSQYALRSANGIGSNLSVDNANPAAVIVNFANKVSIGNIISVGDLLYFGAPSPTLCGKVTDIEIDLPLNINRLIVDTTVAGGSLPPAIDFFLYIKNGTAESHGILGHYAVIKLVNSDTTPTELFVIESEVMKSFP